MEITDQEIIWLKIISCSCKKNFSSPPPSLNWYKKHYLVIIKNWGATKRSDKFSARGPEGEGKKIFGFTK